MKGLDLTACLWKYKRKSDFIWMNSHSRVTYIPKLVSEWTSLITVPSKLLSMLSLYKYHINMGYPRQAKNDLFDNNFLRTSKILLSLNVLVLRTISALKCSYFVLFWCKNCQGRCTRSMKYSFWREIHFHIIMICVRADPGLRVLYQCMYSVFGRRHTLNCALFFRY